VVKQKQPAGEPITLGNMRHLGVQRLIASRREQMFPGLPSIADIAWLVWDGSFVPTPDMTSRRNRSTNAKGELKTFNHPHA
jgi:hypothetical protein